MQCAGESFADTAPEVFLGLCLLQAGTHAGVRMFCQSLHVCGDTCVLAAFECIWLLQQRRQCLQTEAVTAECAWLSQLTQSASDACRE